LARFCRKPERRASRLTCMLTRRDAIRVALGIPVGISALPGWAFAAKEFWETKPASEWTSEEVDRMLTKSPWAKEAVVSYNGGGGDFGDGDSSTTGWPQGPGGGGIGGGGIGGGGIGGGIPGIGGIGGRRGGGTRGADPRGGSSGRQQFHGTVRWESARPIQEALRIGSSEEGTNPDFEKHYVINLLGDMPTVGNGRRRGDNSSSDDDDPAQKERHIERLKDVTRLEHKDGPLLLEKVEQGSRIGRPGPGTLFYFSRLDGISLDDKQVTFITKLGPVEVRTKFIPKDMLYRGKLAL
jgi:hypothetical protein